MKIVKKLSVLVICLILAFNLASCSASSLGVDGHYWLNSSTGFTASFKEVLTYDVSIATKTPSDSTDIGSADYAIEVEKGEYKTTLTTIKSASGDRYVYKTEFVLKGVYKAPEISDVVFEDTFNTQTEFTYDFKPIKTTKSYNSELTNYSYNYKIDYSDSEAVCELVEFPNTDKQKVSNFTFTNYSDGAFIDNDAIYLLVRAYEIDSDFYQQFKTVDVLSRKNHDMLYQVSLAEEDKIDVKNLDNYQINGGEVPSETIACNHVEIKINDTFKGSSIECYYATDRTVNRYRLIESYTYLNANLGYLKLKLKSADVTE